MFDSGDSFDPFQGHPQQFITCASLSNQLFAIFHWGKYA